MSNIHIVVCTGGKLNDWALPYIYDADLCIGADKGALFLVEAGITPYLSIGDFDSVTTEQLEYIKQNSKHTKDFDAIDKDFTDTELALHEAIALKPSKITIVGGLGTRFDHSIANTQYLFHALQHNIDTSIIDENNKLFLVSKSKQVEKEHYHYLSIIPFTDEVHGVTLQGFQYPLSDAIVKRGQAWISNVINDQTATISVKQGTLLVIQSKD